MTWDENAGWAHHFSVQVRKNTAFLPDRLTPLNASPAPQWRDHLGNILRGCTVLGWEQVPHIIAFRFDGGTVVVGDGYQKDRFGDGDDVLVRTEQDAAGMPGMNKAEILWDSAASR